MNNFTKGEWSIFKGGYAHLVECGSGNVICRISWTENKEGEGLANANLIATTGTTATRLAEQGYDAIKVVELLPQLVDVLSDAHRDCGDVGYDAQNLIEQCRVDCGEMMHEQR